MVNVYIVMYMFIIFGWWEIWMLQQPVRKGGRRAVNELGRSIFTFLIEMRQSNSSCSQLLLFYALCCACIHLASSITRGCMGHFAYCQGWRRKIKRWAGAANLIIATIHRKPHHRGPGHEFSLGPVGFVSLLEQTAGVALPSHNFYANSFNCHWDHNSPKSRGSGRYWFLQYIEMRQRYAVLFHHAHKKSKAKPGPALQATWTRAITSAPMPPVPVASEGRPHLKGRKSSSILLTYPMISW